MKNLSQKTTLMLGLVVLLPMFAVSCGQKAPETKDTAATTATETASTQTSAEQQAVIDSLQQPNPEAVKAEASRVSESNATQPSAASEASAKSVQ